MTHLLYLLMHLNKIQNNIKPQNDIKPQDLHNWHQEMIAEYKTWKVAVANCFD